MRLARVRVFALVLAAIVTPGGMAVAEAPPPRTPASAVPTTRPPAGVRQASETRSWPAVIETRLRSVAEQASPDTDAQPFSDDTTEAVRRRLRSLVQHVDRRAKIGVHVRNLDTGATVFDAHGRRPLNPASNHKLLTALAATELLGPRYRFRTRVLRDGDRLILVGEGDPSLQVGDLYRLASEVAASVPIAGIRRIVADPHAFTERRFGPGYPVEASSAAYAAPSGALSLQFNTIEIAIRPADRLGKPLQVHIEPQSAHVQVENRGRTGAGPRLHIVTEPTSEGRTVVRVSGTLRAGHRPVHVRRRIHHPGRFAAETFARILADVTDTPVRPVTLGEHPRGAERVAVHTSRELVRVLGSALKYSNNFTTEQVLRTLAWRATGRPGSWNDGVAVVKRFCKALGLSPQVVRFENGSGLSRDGRLSPHALVDLLARTMNPGTPSASLLSALPRGGREGTIRHRLQGTEGLVRAKTGTLAGVSALTGVIASRTGDAHLGFSIVINGRLGTRTSRHIQDRVVLALLEHLEQSGSSRVDSGSAPETRQRSGG